MWFYTVTTMILVLMGIGIFMLIWEHRKRIAQRFNRVNYSELLRVLESLTAKTNNMAALVEHIRDKKVLDYYESCLRLIEEFLYTVNRVENLERDMISLKSAFVLAAECSKRIDKTYKAFAKDIHAQKINYEQMFHWKIKPDTTILGCYFCSRPYEKDGFKLVKAKIEGVTVTVVGCRICSEEIFRHKKIKVLHFEVNGHRIHWSKMKGFVPSKEYWDLNSKSPSVFKEANLELIYKRPQKHEE